MFRKGSAFFAILSFVVFSTACVYWPTREIRNEGDLPAPGRKVASVVKANGELVDFKGPGLGRLLNDRVEGAALVSVVQEVELQGPLALIKKRADGTVSEITDAKGQVHQVLSVVKQGADGLVITERRGEIQMVSIPLSEVRLIKYRKPNTIMTVMAVAAGAFAAVGVLTALSQKYDWRP